MTTPDAGGHEIMRKRVLLLNPPGPPRVARDYYCGHFTKGSYYWHPTDLLVLSGQLAARHIVDVVDATAGKMPSTEALDRITALRPDVVVSLVAAVSWSADTAFLRGVKEATGAKIAVSGDFARAEPARVLERETSIDAVICNFVDCELARWVEEATGALKGLFLRGHGPPRDGRDAAPFSIPLPRHDLFPLRCYHHPHILHHPFALLMTDFGCPHACRFCYLERVSYRRRDLSGLPDELRAIRALGIGELMMMSASFGDDRPHTDALLEILGNVAPPWSWHCDMRVDAAEDALLAAMKAAGCHTVMMGVESPNTGALEASKKGISADVAVDAFQRAKRHGLRTLAHFIIGLDGDTPESVETLVDYSLRLNPDFASFNLAVPAWGTSFRESLAGAGHEPGVEPADRDAVPRLTVAGFSPGGLREAQSKAMRRFYLRPSYILRQLAGVRTRYQLRSLFVEGFGVLRNAVAPR